MTAIQIGSINLDPQVWEQTPNDIKDLLVAVLDLLKQSEKQAQETKELLLPLLAQAKNIATIRPKISKQIVMICDRPVSRQAKIAHALSTAGWDVILLHKEKSLFDCSRYTSASHQYSSPEQALLLCSLYSPTAYHCFSSWDFTTSAYILANKPGKVIFDDYDTFAGILKEDVFGDSELRQKRIDQERYCLENADGLCCRSLSLQVAKRELQYAISSKIIFFPEYCWNSYATQGVQRTPRLSDGLHVVYVGDPMVAQSHNSNDLGTTNFQYIRSVLSNKIHFHLHPCLCPNTDFESYLSEHIALEKTNPYFHLYRPMPCDELIKRLQVYHVGLATAANRIAHQGCSSYSATGYKYMTNNKTFDYLDAGLKVACFGSPIIDRLLKPFGVSLYVSKEDSIEALKQLSPDDFDGHFEAQVLRAQRQLATSHHVKRLISFYESV